MRRGSGLHLNRRHKRFHVLPEAEGIGWRAFLGVPGRGPDAAKLGEAEPENAEQGSAQPECADPRSVQKTVARNGLSLCLAVLVAAVALPLLYAHFGSLFAFMLWLRDRAHQPPPWY